MSEIEYKIGNVADAFKDATDKRFASEKSDNVEISVAFEILQDELFKALRVLENAIISK